MLAKNLEQSWAMLVKKIIIWRCGDDGKMNDEDLFVQSWLYVHMIYELLRWFMHQGTDHSKIYIIHHIVKFVFTAQVLVTSDEILFGQIFGLILHTHCRRPARLTEATSIVLSYPWWASALGFSRWVFNVFLSVVFSTLAAPGSTSFQAIQRSSAVQFVLCQDAPGLPEMPTKTALGVRMKFALGLCPWVLHSELQSTQSPTETVSTRKGCVSYFRCLWVIFVGNFGLKILGFGLFSSSALCATIFRGKNLGALARYSGLRESWFPMFVGLRRGSLGTWGDWSCAGTSRGAATQPLLSLPLPTLPTNNLCLLCPQTITVMIIDAPNIGKPNIQTENSGTFREKKKIF